MPACGTGPSPANSITRMPRSGPDVVMPGSLAAAPDRTGTADAPVRAGRVRPACVGCPIIRSATPTRPAVRACRRNAPTRRGRSGSGRLVPGSRAHPRRRRRPPDRRRPPARGLATGHKGDAMRRHLFEDEHDAFRESFRRFLEKEVVPHYAQWERDGIVPREVFPAAGANGFLGMAVPEEYGGGGVDDFRFNVVIAEETARVGVTAFGLGRRPAQRHRACPTSCTCTDAEQKARWLPGHRLRRADHGDRHDRARHRLRPRLDADDGRPRRRRLRRRRLEDVHHERHQRRPRRHRGEDRPGAAAQGHAACSCSSAACPASTAAATSTRSACTPRTPPSCSSPASASPSRTCSARRAGASRTCVTNLPQERLSIAVGAAAAARAALRVDASTTSRSARRSASRSGRSRTSRFRLAEMKTEIDIAEQLPRRLRPRAGRRRAHRRGRRQGQVVVHRAAGPGRSTPPSSCTAATAT